MTHRSATKRVRWSRLGRLFADRPDPYLNIRARARPRGDRSSCESAGSVQGSFVFSAHASAPSFRRELGLTRSEVGILVASYAIGVIQARFLGAWLTRCGRLRETPGHWSPAVRGRDDSVCAVRKHGRCRRPKSSAGCRGAADMERCSDLGGQGEPSSSARRDAWLSDRSGHRGRWSARWPWPSAPN
jgi:hypothetical protein